MEQREPGQKDFRRELLEESPPSPPKKRRAGVITTAALFGALGGPGCATIEKPQSMDPAVDSVASAPFNNVERGGAHAGENEHGDVEDVFVNGIDAARQRVKDIKLKCVQEDRDTIRAVFPTLLREILQSIPIRKEGVEKLSVAERINIQTHLTRFVHETEELIDHANVNLFADHASAHAEITAAQLVLHEWSSDLPQEIRPMSDHDALEQVLQNTIYGQMNQSLFMIKDSDADLDRDAPGWLDTISRRVRIFTPINSQRAMEKLAKQLAQFPDLSTEFNRRIADLYDRGDALFAKALKKWDHATAPQETQERRQNTTVVNAYHEFREFFHSLPKDMQPSHLQKWIPTSVIGH